MAQYSKSLREYHKERIRMILLRDPKITIWKCIDTLKTDKKNPISLYKNYVGKILNELRDEMVVNMQSENVKNMLSDYALQYDEMRKKYLDIVDKPPIITHVVTIPDLDKDPTGEKGLTKKIIELEKTTNKDRMEAMAKFENAGKEYRNAMIIIGNVPGSEEVDMAKLNPNMNIAIQNNFITEKELELQEKEKLKELEKLEKLEKKLLEKEKPEKIVEAEIIQD